MLRDSTGVPLVDAALTYVQGEAQTQAIPIAINAVQPYLVVSIILGILGAGLGFSAYVSTRSMRKRAA